MNELEIKILNFIKNRGSFEKPVPRKRLEAEFSLNKRAVEIIVEDLRKKYKQPIVASKKAGNSGYYLPRDDYERSIGLKPYTEQIVTSQQTVTAIMSVDLKEYWKGHDDERATYSTI